MVLPIRFKLGDTTIYSRAFEMMERQAADLAVPLREIGDVLIADVGEQFASEGAWSGHSWAPLSDKYSQWKEQHYPGMPLLVATGRMRAALLDPAQSLVVTAHTLRYEPDSDIAIYHQEGTPTMPARPPIDIPTPELREWDRVMVRWLRATSDPLWGSFHR